MFYHLLEIEISGLEHVGGNMFETVPQGDAILVKVISPLS